VVETQPRRVPWGSLSERRVSGLLTGVPAGRELPIGVGIPEPKIGELVGELGAADGMLGEGKPVDWPAFEGTEEAPPLT
jgi:hypothetical protein